LSCPFACGRAVAVDIAVSRSRPVAVSRFFDTSKLGIDSLSDAEFEKHVAIGKRFEARICQR